MRHPRAAHSLSRQETVSASGSTCKSFCDSPGRYRLYDSSLGDDPSNQPCRGYIEGWAIARHVRRGGLPAESSPNLIRPPLLNWDSGSILHCKIKRTAWRCDVKWDSVVPGEHRYGVCAYLVGGIAVGGDSIGPDYDEIDLARLHKSPGHVVTEQGHVQTGTLQLPRCQSSSLQQGASFVGIHSKRPPGLMGGVERSQRSAVLRGRQRSCVAVRQYAAAGLDQRGTVAADSPAHRRVFAPDTAGFFEQRLLNGRHALPIPASAPSPSCAPGPTGD